MIFPNGPRYRPVQGSGSFLQEKGPRSKQIENQAYVSNRGKPYIPILATIYDFTQAPFQLGAGRNEAVQTRAKDPEGPGLLPGFPILDSGSTAEPTGGRIFII